MCLSCVFIFFIQELDDKLTQLFNLVLQLFDEFAPLKPVNTSHVSLPRVTRNVRHVMHKRIIVRMKWKKCADGQAEDLQWSECNKLSEQILTLMLLNEEICFADLAELPMCDRWAKLNQALAIMHPFENLYLMNNHIIDSIPTRTSSIPDVPTDSKYLNRILFLNCSFQRH